MDKSLLGDLDLLPEEDKVRMSAMIEQLQIRDSLRMYNTLVERCFTDCVDTFRRKSLDKQEETCPQMCREVLEALDEGWHEIRRTKPGRCHTRLNFF